jgi:hypothetical protein
MPLHVAVAAVATSPVTASGLSHRRRRTRVTRVYVSHASSPGGLGQRTVNNKNNDFTTPSTNSSLYFRGGITTTTVAAPDRGDRIAPRASNRKIRKIVRSSSSSKRRSSSSNNDKSAAVGLY